MRAARQQRTHDPRMPGEAEAPTNPCCLLRYARARPPGAGSPRLAQPAFRCPRRARGVAGHREAGPALLVTGQANDAPVMSPPARHRSRGAPVRVRSVSMILLRIASRNSKDLGAEPVGEDLSACGARSGSPAPAGAPRAVPVRGRMAASDSRRTPAVRGLIESASSKTSRLGAVIPPTPADHS